MATRVDVGSRVEPHGVGTGVAAAGADGQPVQVVGPAGLVGGDLAGGEVTVGEADQRTVALWDQLDLDHAGAGGQRAALDLPAPGEHDPPGRVDLQEATDSPPVATDVHAEHPARARVELGLQPLPLQPAPPRSTLLPDPTRGRSLPAPGEHGPPRRSVFAWCWE